MSIIRVITTYKHDVVHDGQWCAAQVNVGIVCACLPTLGLIVTSIRDANAHFRQLMSSKLSCMRLGFSRGRSTPGSSIDEPSIDTTNGHRGHSKIAHALEGYQMKASKDISPSEASRDTYLDNNKQPYDEVEIV